MTTSTIYDELKNAGVFLKGHFVYSHGLHGEDYVDKYALYKRPMRTAEISKNFIPLIKNLGIDTIVGPEKGGIYLSQWTAFWLSKQLQKEVISISAYKSGRGFGIRPEYHTDVQGKRILIVEDVITTGESARTVIRCVQRLHGDIVGLAAICNRGEFAGESLGLPWFSALVSLRLKSWTSDTCPLCAAGIPVNQIHGHGKKFVAQQRSMS